MKKKMFILTVFVGLGLFAFIGLSNNSLFSPISTNAQQTPEYSFDELNELVKQNNASPDLTLSITIADGLFDNLSVINIPKVVQDPLSEDIATSYLNGSSAIDETNIVFAINNLANQASAPSYASTNVEQVKVVRTVLSRLIPDLVSSNGSMNDMEAYAVFVAIASQKVGNEAYMVSEAEFTTTLNTTPIQPFPGTTEFETNETSIVQSTLQMDEMLNVLTSYSNSKDLASTGDIISWIGIN